MARTKNSSVPDYTTEDEQYVPVKQECSDPHCDRKRVPTSPDDLRRRYDAAAVLRSDARRAMKSARLAVDEAIRSLEHASSTAENAYNAEVDASNETRGSLSKRRHQGEPALGRFQGEGAGF